mmetsp:Transcript_33863/g.83721  ORF Transcript_33863/g.83721 Transcript_33863/m.83721 type:complete len:211 (+) Transcript_33863:71-703(+)
MQKFCQSVSQRIHTKHHFGSPPPTYKHSTTSRESQKKGRKPNKHASESDQPSCTVCVIHPHPPLTPLAHLGRLSVCLAKSSPGHPDATPLLRSIDLRPALPRPLQSGVSSSTFLDLPHRQTDRQTATRPCPKLRQLATPYIAVGDALLALHGHQSSRHCHRRLLTRHGTCCFPASQSISPLQPYWALLQTQAVRRRNSGHDPGQQKTARL